MNNIKTKKIATSVTAAAMLAVSIPFTASARTFMEDGKFTAADATLILKHVAGLQELTGDNIKAADLDGDEHISVNDATLILKKVAGQYSSHKVTFPAHDFGRTEYNSKILDVTPFELKVDLPKGWSIHIPQSKDEYTGGFASVDIMQNGKAIGSIDYDIYPSGKYDNDPNGEIDETQSNAYVQIYNQIMLGSGVNWNNDYKEVNKIGDTIASTCRIMVRDVPEDEYQHGILARNKPLGVYVKIAVDASVSSDTIEYIAKTIEIK